MLNNRKNKRAQIGEAMTWVTATIIIVVLLTIFIYASIALAKTKNISLSDSKISLSKDKDIVFAKSLFAYEKTSEEKKVLVKEWIEKNEK